MLTYSTYVTSFANMLVVPTSDSGFNTMLPNAIDDAEQRAYRDLQLLNTVVRDTSITFTTNTRTFNLPSAQGTFLVVDSLYAITPAGTVNPDQGTHNQLTPASRPFIDALFPSSAGSGVPAYFAPTTQNAFIVGPWPDQAYQAEVVGTIRPAALSSTNVTTLLSWYFPDLFLAASMVFGSAYQSNFGAAGAVDNPAMGINWESHYKTLLESAETEEAMKKFTSQGWSSKAPAPLATPPRT
jgi:hypothetical protein